MPIFLNQKGIAPLVVVIIIGVVVLGWVGLTRGSFNFLGKKGDSSTVVSAELDCLQVMNEVGKGKLTELEWNGEKKTVTYQDKDYCQLQREQIGKAAKIAEVVKITYYQIISDAEEKLKDLTTKGDSAVKLSGYCLIEYSPAEGEKSQNILDNIDKNEKFAGFCKDSARLKSGDSRSPVQALNQTGKGGQFDCLATLSEAESSSWNTVGKVTAGKQTVSQTDKDYCLLKHQSQVSDYGAGFGEVEDPVIDWTVKITYFGNKIGPNEAFPILDKLKNSEKNGFKANEGSFYGYDGQTVDLSGPSYLRNVMFQEHCLIEQTVESNFGPLFKGNGVFKWSVSDAESQMGMIGASVASLLYNLQNNQKFSSFCN